MVVALAIIEVQSSGNAANLNILFIKILFDNQLINKTTFAPWKRKAFAR